MRPTRALVTLPLLFVLCCAQAAPKVFQGADAGQRHLSQEEEDELVFPNAKAMLMEQLSSAAFSSVLEVTHLDECVAYFDDIFPKDCTPDKLATADVKACCRAGRYFVDDGSCLCELQIARGMLAEGSEGLVTMAGFCGIAFPIPDDPVHFIEDPSSVAECQPFQADNINGKLAPEFLGLSEQELEQTSPEDLPTFGDLYEAPRPGPFYVNYGIIDVPRPKPSILINDKSNEMDFKALVVYPVDTDPLTATSQGFERQEDQPLSSRGPFPVLAFSPGFEVSPNQHFRTFHHLASHGIIVISQYSTEGIVTDFSRETSLAWMDDIVYSLKHMVQLGSESGSWAEGGVDVERLAVGGHSMGGGLSMLATVMAKEEYDLGVKVSMHVAPACRFRGRECEFATEGASRLQGVDVLFIGGDMDNVEKLSYAQFFQSQLPQGTESELVVLEGATHCLWEDDPVRWKSVLECGKGTKSPFEAIREMQDAMLEFLGAKGFVGGAQEERRGAEQGGPEQGDTEDEATEDEATEDEATEDGATEDEATGDEATEDEATEDEATEDEATETGVSEQEEASPEGPATRASRGELSTGAEQEEEGAAEPEQEDAQATEPDQEAVVAERPSRKAKGRKSAQPEQEEEAPKPEQEELEAAEPEQPLAEVEDPEQEAASVKGPPKRVNAKNSAQPGQQGAAAAAPEQEAEGPPKRVEAGISVQPEQGDAEAAEPEQEGENLGSPPKRVSGPTTPAVPAQEGTTLPGPPMRRVETSNGNAPDTEGEQEIGQGEGEQGAPNEGEQEEAAPASPRKRGKRAKKGLVAEQGEAEDEETEPEEAAPMTPPKRGQTPQNAAEAEEGGEVPEVAQQAGPGQEESEESEQDQAESAPTGRRKRRKKGKKSKGSDEEEGEIGQPEQEEPELDEAGQGEAEQGEAEQSETEQSEAEQGEADQEAVVPKKHKKRGKKKTKKSAEAEQDGGEEGEAGRDDPEQNAAEQEEGEEETAPELLKKSIKRKKKAEE